MRPIFMALIAADSAAALSGLACSSLFIPIAMHRRFGQGGKEFQKQLPQVMRILCDAIHIFVWACNHCNRMVSR
jgi:hypothetical protein